MNPKSSSLKRFWTCVDSGTVDSVGLASAPHLWLWSQSQPPIRARKRKSNLAVRVIEHRMQTSTRTIRSSFYDPTYLIILGNICIKSPDRTGRIYHVWFVGPETRQREERVISSCSWSPHFRIMRVRRHLMSLRAMLSADGLVIVRFTAICQGGGEVGSKTSPYFLDNKVCDSHITAEEGLWQLSPSSTLIPGWP